MSRQAIRAAASLAVAVSLGAALACGHPGQNVAEAQGPSSRPTCIQAWPEARYRNYAYDHIVHVLNGCTRWATCDVSTNVNPDPIRVRVGPGEHQQVLTFRGSPASEFTPKVDCWLDSD